MLLYGSACTLSVGKAEESKAAGESHSNTAFIDWCSFGIH